MKKEVLIVYNYIAHYRVPIFSLLSRNTSPEYTIAAGDKSDISIKLMDSSNLSNESLNGGVRWLRIANFWFFKFFLLQPATIKLSLGKKYQTIIFLGNMYYLTTWVAAVLARFRGKKVVFWTHGFIREERNFQGFVRKMFYKLANEILVYGQRAKDIMVGKGFSEDKIKLIYNSLDFDNQVNIINENKNPKGINLFNDKEIPIIGFIGRLTPQKNVGLILDVQNELKKKNIPINLLIIGDGIERERLDKKVRELNLEDNVNFYGACYDEFMIYELMKNMRLIVSPGEVGLTAIHALTYGVPVITHNKFDKQMPEYESVLDGVTGGFFEYENPKSSLEKVLIEWLSKSDLDHIREQCFNVIKEKYNPHVQVQIFNKIV